MSDGKIFCDAGPYQPTSKPNSKALITPVAAQVQPVVTQSPSLVSFVTEKVQS